MRLRALGSIGVLASILTVAVAVVLAQAPAAPTFEVASVKPNTCKDPTCIQFGIQPGGSLRLIDFPLHELIRMAYQVQDKELVAPDWTKQERFDILARAASDLPPLPPPGTWDGSAHPVFPMLRSLLEERFKLIAHRETRTIAEYALVIARSDGTLGPQLHRSDTDCDMVLAARRAAQQSGSDIPASAAGQPRPCGAIGTSTPNVRIVADSMSVSYLVAVLAGPAQRPLVDRTGLTGRVSFTLEYDAFDRSTDVPGFFTAVEEQLGLKFESIRENADVLVIDHVERPSEN